MLQRVDLLLADNLCIIFLQSEPVEVGCYVAIRCRKYKERPLIGKVAEILKRNVPEWMTGTYSGTWRAWKGREGKRSVMFTDEIPIQDVLQGVQFTKSNRFSPSTVQALKWRTN